MKSKKLKRKLLSQFSNFLKDTEASKLKESTVILTIDRQGKSEFTVAKKITTIATLFSEESLSELGEQYASRAVLYKRALKSIANEFPEKYNLPVVDLVTLLNEKNDPFKTLKSGKFHGIGNITAKAIIDLLEAKRLL